jgi:hypothetical protein
MSEEQIVLARRAVACKGWKWLPGMRWQTDDDQGRLDDGQPEYMAEDMGRPDDALPDLTDEATVGCLLALVREVRREPTGFVAPTHAGGPSYYMTMTSADWYLGDTNAEALVAALEAAP